MRLHFRGGVFDGSCLALAAPYTPETLYVAASPEPQLEVLIVGTERIPPGVMFPDAVEYRLDRDASDLVPHLTFEGMEVGDAVYVEVT